MSVAPPPVRPAPSPFVRWRHVFAGLSASLIGIGLARFAYTPLIPLLIRDQWFSANDIVYLGAANLAGYLIGAIVGRPIAERTDKVNTLRAMKLVICASLLACAFPLSVSWFFVWRLLSGIAGGAIMVLVAATVLPHIPSHQRGIASGAVFLGVGLGIAASGTLVPLLVQYGLRETWIGLAAFAALLTAASWSSWPIGDPLDASTEPSSVAKSATQPHALTIGLIYTDYGLMAVGLVPPMVFLVDFVARGLGAGAHLGALFWILYGVGAILGPPVYGLIADRIGALAAVRVLLGVQAVALAGIALSGNLLVIATLAVIAGSFPPGIVPMVLAWDRETYPGDAEQQNILWSRATIVFAACQAAAGYGFSAVFDYSGGDHRILFALAAGAIAVALALDFIVPPLARRRA